MHLGLLLSAKRALTSHLLETQGDRPLFFVGVTVFSLTLCFTVYWRCFYLGFLAWWFFEAKLGWPFFCGCSGLFSVLVVVCGWFGYLVRKLDRKDLYIVDLVVRFLCYL